MPSAWKSFSREMNALLSFWISVKISLFWYHLRIVYTLLCMYAQFLRLYSYLRYHFVLLYKMLLHLSIFIYSISISHHLTYNVFCSSLFLFASLEWKGLNKRTFTDFSSWYPQHSLKERVSLLKKRLSGYLTIHMLYYGWRPV